MQSCLEKRGMEERHTEINRSDYNINDQYSATHPDALSDGDIQGSAFYLSGIGWWYCGVSGDT